MKKLMLLTIIILSVSSFARDYEFNEKRDIVAPMEEQIDRLSRSSVMELELEDALRDMNIEKYSEFHKDLDRSDMGENSER